MKLTIGRLDTTVKTYNGRPDLQAYVQVWDLTQPHGKMVVCSHIFEQLTPRQWQRFRRLQDALALVPVGEAA